MPGFGIGEGVWNLFANGQDTQRGSGADTVASFASSGNATHWSPKSEAGGAIVLRKWHYAHLGVTKDGSDFVSAWGDFSGGADTTATGTAKPKWRAAQTSTGKPALQFDGSDDYMLSAACDLSAGVAATLFIVARRTSATLAVLVEAGPTNQPTDAGLSLFGSATNSDEIEVWSKGTTSTYQRAASTDAHWPVNAFQVLCHRVDGAAGSGAEMEAFVDDVLATLSYLNGPNEITGNLGTPQLSIGSRAGALPLVGDIAGIVLYAGKLSDAAKTRVKNNLKKIFGTP